MRYLQLNKEYPASGYWDQTILEELFDRENVVVIPGAYQAEYIDDINMELANYDYCVVIISSDEEGKFPAEELYHPKMKVYRQYLPADRQIPIGTPPNPPIKLDKHSDYAYLGQVNTEDRREVDRVLQSLNNSYLLTTKGFAQGLPREDYNKVIGQSKIVPCPSGWISPDSFRLYEALGAGCTPVILSKHKDYFKFLGDFPFPVIDEWSELKDVGYKDYSDWWAGYKARMVDNLNKDLEELRWM